MCAVTPDHATASNHEEIRVEHIDLDWSIDWAQHIIRGTATLDLRAVRVADRVILDTAELSIEEISVQGLAAQWELRRWELGSALWVTCEDTLQQRDQLRLVVRYQTAPNNPALSWDVLPHPNGTVNPMMYSQCQTIYARCLMPCQDTPASKFTFSASVTSAHRILMSASPVLDVPSSGPLPHASDTLYLFRQTVPITTSIFAIAGGPFQYRQLVSEPVPIGIWATPDVLHKAVKEFGHPILKFMQVATRLAGRYRFPRYDVLFLPPSFPHGGRGLSSPMRGSTLISGMENACLTFLSPALLTGDGSTVDTCAHELCHSWFGNLVGCASWADFWLNEGWTTYMERLLLGELYGEDVRRLAYAIGYNTLEADLRRFDTPNTRRFRRLVTNYRSGEVCTPGINSVVGGSTDFQHPDDAYSQVPYEKGSNLLLHLEGLCPSKDVFLAYMREYIDAYAGKAVSSSTWHAHLVGYFREHHPPTACRMERVEWDAWLHGEGDSLPNLVDYDSALVTDVHNALQYVNQPSATPGPPLVAALEPMQQIYLLDLVEQRSYSVGTLDCLAAQHKWRPSLNPEIRFRYYRMMLRLQPDLVEEAAKWVRGQGWMRYSRPIMRALGALNPHLSRSVILDPESAFHPIARKMMLADLDQLECRSMSTA